MGIKDQLMKLKENWLLILLVLVVIIFSGGFNLLGSLSSLGSTADFANMAEGVSYKSETYYGDEYYTTPYSPPSQDFAPEVEERLIVKTATLSTEIERGEFQTAQDKLKSITTASDAYILNENVRRYGEGRKSYYTGSYQIKVDVLKYDSVVSQLKDIGEVQSFVEDTQDITGSYTNLQTEIDVEKQRLQRYKEMFEKATIVEDQIEINDRIFNQERSIRYLEERLRTMDQRVEYSTISFTMNEERYEYIDVALVKLSQLIQNLVNSFNAMLHIASWLLPWGILYLVVKIVFNAIKKRKLKLK